MLKDLNLAMAEAEGQGLAMPVSGLTRDLYQEASSHYGAKDFGVMLEYLKEISKAS
jgi:3-hydroxyisobutyrate dehydrogenase-like beta-hydroxyacid dehydrogenase